MKKSIGIMRIAVNARFLIKNKLEGIGWFTYETMKRIVRSHPEHEFVFLFDRAFDPEFIFAENVKPVILKPQARHPLLWYIWFEYSVREFIKKNRIDIFLSPDGYVSLKTDIPQLAVIHDINFYHYPKALPPLTRRYFNFFFPRFAKKATRIVTVSEFSKKDIVESYRIDPSKIDVALNGANDQYNPINELEKEATRRELTRGKPYFLFIGAFNPRKNLANLLEAYDIFKSRTESEIKLVIVGERMHGTSAMVRAYDRMRFKDEIVFTGRMQVGDLKNVVGSAFALTFVSYYEGFGIPLLEAMRCDIPIVASKCTSIPEVAADAAIYVDPFDIESITEAMIEISKNELLRTRLIENARHQKQKFSWDRTAEILYNSIQKSINKPC